MISRSHRFHGYNSLRFVYQRGQTVRGPLLALKFAHNERRSAYRLGVVVSKKVSKSAVLRNRIRRRLYELVREVSEQISGPYGMVFIVYSEQLAELPAKELKTLVLGQLKQSGVLKTAA